MQVSFYNIYVHTTIFTVGNGVAILAMSVYRTLLMLLPVGLAIIEKLVL